jgi:hypothetical protein
MRPSVRDENPARSSRLRVIHSRTTLLVVPTSIRLDSETEALLARLAARRKQTRSAVVRDSIALLAAQERDAVGAPYARIAHLVGSFDSGGARLSEATGRKFRDALGRSRRERDPR